MSEPDPSLKQRIADLELAVAAAAQVAVSLTEIRGRLVRLEHAFAKESDELRDALAKKANRA